MLSITNFFPVVGLGVVPERKRKNHTFKNRIQKCCVKIILLAYLESIIIIFEHRINLLDEVKQV
jgi:hypothetical protein